MKPPVSDTPPAIRQRLIEGYRRMSPAEKMERVAALNRAAVQLATARIREQYGPDLSPRELRLRLGSLWLSRETMIEVFGWDPEVHGR